MKRLSETFPPFETKKKDVTDDVIDGRRSRKVGH